MIGAPSHDNRRGRRAWWTPSRRLGPRRLEQLTGVGPSRFAVGVAREHARELDDAVFAVDRSTRRHGSPRHLGLFDADLMVGAGGHLGEVGDHDDLSTDRRFAERLAERKG